MNLSYAAAARIGALVVPVGPMPVSRLVERVHMLQEAADVALIGTRLPEGSDAAQCAQFDPQTSPNGRVHFDFTTQPVPEPLAALADLEPWRQQLVVIGVVDNGSPEGAIKSLRQRFPQSLCHVVLVWDADQETVNNNEKHVYVVPSKFAGLESTLTDVVGEILAQISIFWLSRRVGTFESPQAKLTAPSPKTIPPINELSNGSSDPKSRRRHHTLTIGRNGSISMGTSERARARQQGRTAKFLGALLLLAGRPADALAELAEAAQILKESRDHLWYASALDQIGVCMALLQLDGAPFTVPAIVQSVIGQSENSFGLAKQLSMLADTVLDQYRRSEEAVPHTVYYDTILRIASLEARRRRLGLGEKLTWEVVAGLEVQTPSKRLSMADLRAVDHWLQQVLSPALNDLPVGAQARLLSAVAQLCSLVGLKRKAALVSGLLVSVLGSKDLGFHGSGSNITGPVEKALKAYNSWPRLYASTLRNTVALGERIGDIGMQIHAAATLLGMAVWYPIDNKEQMALHRLIRSTGDAIPHAYWDPHMLVDVTIKLPARQKTPKSTAGTSGADGIIYNPFERTIDKSEPGIEAGVPNIARVYLRNPFAVEAHVYELSLVNSSNEPVSETVRDVLLPPETVSIRVDVPIIAREAGRTEITGCYIQVSGSSGAVYALPREPYNLLVYPHRPVLMLHQLSLQKGWIMLLEGEKTNFSLKLWNASARTPASFLQFGFNDSTVEPLRQLAAKPDTSKPELYEYEYFLHKRRAIEMVSPLHAVAPQESESFNFTLVGKRGLTSAAILVDYGLAEDDPNMRRLRIPLLVTVYPSIELERFDLLPSPTHSSEILVILDLRNAWRDPLDVTISSDGRPDVMHSISSGGTSRFLVRVAWSPLKPELLSQPIPSAVGPKQFVRDTRTPPEVTQMFWLREELLKKLHGRWRTTHNGQGDRFGKVELRGIQLSRTMADVLRPEPMELSAAFEGELLVDNVVTLIVTLRNRSDVSKTGMLRLVPDAASQNYMLYMGTLQKPLKVAPQAEVVVKMELVYLARGKYEWTSVFDVLTPSRSQVFQTDRIGVHIEGS